MMPLLASLIPFSEGDPFNPIDLAAGGNLFWTWLIFLIAMPLIWMVVMGPITRALEERDAKAEDAIAAAEKAGREAEAARAKLEVSLGEAEASSAKLIAEARVKAEARGQEIVGAAKVEAGALVDSARKAIRVEQDKAIAAIRGEVVDLSLHAASQLLDRKVDAEDDRRFVTQVIGSEAVARG